tara:strand:- start:11 stop:286 length:276 start_codon:yes stop_codon:yes gene_type:complete
VFLRTSRGNSVVCVVVLCERVVLVVLSVKIVVVIFVVVVVVVATTTQRRGRVVGGLHFIYEESNRMNKNQQKYVFFEAHTEMLQKRNKKIV